MSFVKIAKSFFLLSTIFALSACTEAEKTAYEASLNSRKKEPATEKILEKNGVAEKKLDNKTDDKKKTADAQSEGEFYSVLNVVDGDTIDVDMDGKIKRIRMIGVNTPESVDPRRTVECFGIEASNKAKELLGGQKVRLEADPTQDEQDKYGRLLRYVWRADGLFYNLEIIKAGYAYEYTYQVPYKFQKEFKEAQKEAESQKAGLWADDTCAGGKSAVKTSTATKQNASAPANPSCDIKGNINSKKEKIYHAKNCSSYNDTVIDTSQGERWFCSEDEAVKAGWRKAGNCK